MIRRATWWAGLSTGLGLLLLQAPAVGAGADDPEPTGREIAARVDARPRGLDQSARAVWRLVDKAGRERVRETRLFWRDYRGADDGLRSKRLIVFVAPTAIKDTAFLVWNNRAPDRDDHRWIYLPAARKVRRISGRDRGNSFVGTDFLYEDLSDREVEDDVHRLMGREQDGTGSYYLVESIPVRDDAPYSRRISRVRAGDWITTRVAFYGRSGRHEKTLDLEWRRVQGLWTWKRLEMRNLRSEHSTVVEIDEVVYDEGIDDDLFSERVLRRGAR